MLRTWTTGCRGEPLRTLDHDTMRLALNIIGYVGFGLRLLWPGQALPPGSDPRLVKYASLDAPPGHKMSFVDTMASLMDNILLLLLLLTPKWLLRVLPSARARRSADAYAEYVKYMDEIMEDKLDEARAGDRADEGMDLMVHLARTAYRSADAPVLTRDEIMSNAFIMFVAGHETTANTLHFCMVQLATNPSAQRRLQRDIDDLLGDSDPATWDYEALVNAMTASMMGACMYETLRIMPPAAELPKKVSSAQDQPLMVDRRRYTVPRGTAVSMAEEDYGGPAGPDTSAQLFRPERGAYIPFSDGARSCLGRRIAQVEMMAALAVVFRENSLELAVDGGDDEAALARMDRAERRRAYGRAQARRRWTMRQASSLITLKLRGDLHVPLRVVRRGEERFVSWMDDYVDD